MLWLWFSGECVLKGPKSQVNYCRKRCADCREKCESGTLSVESLEKLIMSWDQHIGTGIKHAANSVCSDQDTLPFGGKCKLGWRLCDWEEAHSCRPALQADPHKYHYPEAVTPYRHFSVCISEKMNCENYFGNLTPTYIFIFGELVIFPPLVVCKYRYLKGFDDHEETR